MNGRAFVRPRRTARAGQKWPNTWRQGRGHLCVRDAQQRGGGVRDLGRTARRSRLRAPVRRGRTRRAGPLARHV